MAFAAGTAIISATQASYKDALKCIQQYTAQKKHLADFENIFNRLSLRFAFRKMLKVILRKVVFQ